MRTTASSPAPAGQAGLDAELAAPRFFGPGYLLAFLAVTFAGFMQAYAASPALVPRARLVPLALACGSYALLGTLAPYALARRGSRAGLRILVLALLVLGAFATLLSHGYTAMMLLALVSASVLYLGFAGSAAIGVLSAALALAGFALRAPLPAALLQAEAAFASGLAFVYVFSRAALREQRAHAEARRLAAQLAAANAQLAAQAGHAEQLATVKERNRIAREIHDGLGHYLTVIHVQLQAAEVLLEREPERARAAIARARQLTHEGLQDVRRSVALLRGEGRAGPPLGDALRGLLESCVTAGPPAALRIEGEPRSLPEPVELTLYRAAQEALTNARRHARAGRVELVLRYDRPGIVGLRVSDDGVGASAWSSGYGLVGVRERAESIGGTVAITSEPGRGFTLELEVPA